VGGVTDEEWRKHALARNDRYLSLIETFEFCPFALRCRETGGLHRRVLLFETPDETAVLQAIAELEQPAFAAVEIGLLLQPKLTLRYEAMEQFAASLRQRMKESQLREFFIVAFHPEAPVDTTTPERLVSLLRRSPDPTFQLVRGSLLDRVRGGSGDTRWIDLKKTDLRAPPPPPPPSLSEKIGAQNAETVQRLGADRLVELLAELRK
jgi:hypothetical protein